MKQQNENLAAAQNEHPAENIAPVARDSDTPRVDQVLSATGDGDQIDIITLAKNLERELNAERKRILDRVQLMREGEADSDLRSLLSFIRRP